MVSSISHTLWQPQNSWEMSTVSGFLWAIRPVIQRSPALRRGLRSPAMPRKPAVLSSEAAYGSAPTAAGYTCLTTTSDTSTEIHMYIGGGILGLILLVAVILFVMRRA
jgi:hypothetical protein